MNGQNYQEAGYETARPLEGWLDNGWPGEGVFPHSITLCSMAYGLMALGWAYMRAAFAVARATAA